ncbi:TPA: hypothetical protein ACVNQO_001229 [Escherichia coli]|nr:hypothetical protein [Escherichia coli]EII7668889.1 hypothetical protein [Escherichia coli]
MIEILADLKTELENIITKINSTIPTNDPLSIAYNNWSFPGITKAELISKAEDIFPLLESVDGDFFDDSNGILLDSKRRLRFLSDSTIPNIPSNAALAVPNYLITLESLKGELNNKLDRNHSADLQKAVRRLRALEARLNQLEPKSGSLSSMVERIEQAFNTAEQLPADMELLNESRNRIKEIVTKSNSDSQQLAITKDGGEEQLSKLRIMRTEAEEVLKRCETAYAASTSVGLSAAFNERSDALNKSMTFWIVGLIIALITAAGFGSFNVHGLLLATTEAQPSTSVIITRIFLSMLSIGGPIWFAWLATKQIGQRFRLSEDYAFKASISRAYEGFRSEAARIDKNMEAQLLASALSRLDELPLRLVETETHGSPYHELLSSDTFKEALKVVPGFSDRVKSMAEQAIHASNDAINAVAKNTNKAATAEKAE